MACGNAVVPQCAEAIGYVLRDLMRLDSLRGAA